MSLVPSFCGWFCHVLKYYILHFLYGKTLPLFLSDIFSQIKCLSLHSNIFMQISNVLNFFDFNFFDFNDRWSIINDLQWSMVFNDHSILLHRDYYWLIMDYNHDFGLEHFPDLEISRLRNFPTSKFDFKLFQLWSFWLQFSLMIIGIQWSFNTTAPRLLLINHGL